jgi:pyridoxine 5-phosphate synthase
MTTRLSVNLNKVALLRNSRTLGIPSVTRAATIALDAGAHGITVHPRPDGRHIRRDDVRDLAELLKRRPQAEFNIEGNPFHELLEMAARCGRSNARWCPTSVEAFTSDPGWDLARDGARLEPIIAELHGLGVRVSLFMDPTAGSDGSARARSAPIASSSIRSPTLAHSALPTKRRRSSVMPRRHAQRNRPGSASTRDTTSIAPICPASCRPCRQVLEVSIGHALIADALEAGLAQTVRSYLTAIAGGGRS